MVTLMHRILFLKKSKITYVFISKVAKNMFVMPRVSYKPSLEEGNVEYGGIEIDELEKEHFERQIVIEF